MPNIDIGVDLGGIHLSTPFLIASGPRATSIGEIYKHAEQIAQNAWAGVVTKTIISKYGTELKPHLWSSPDFRLMGMQNAGPALTIYNKLLVTNLKRDAEAAHAAGIKLIVSLMGSTYDEWGEMAHECEQAGADGVELNLSCPSPRAAIRSSMGGYQVGQDPELSARVVEATVSSTRLPVIAKMTAHANDVTIVAKACEEAGSSAISGINTVRGLIGIDIQTEVPMSSDVEGRCYCSGLSGPLIKPIALGVCANLALTVGIPVSAIGGIVNWKDAVEFMLVGASAVQLCTGVMWYGFALGRRLRRGLKSYMAEKGYSSIDNFKGHALRHITSEMPEEYPPGWYMELSPDKCNMCRMCVIACRDGSCGAIEEADEILRIDRSKCNLCGLCSTVCKPQAITLQKERTGLG